MQTNSRSSRLVKGIVIIIMIIAVVSIAFILWTYPRSTLSFPVTFTIGAANQEKVFDVPAFDNSVQVQVKINNGASLWQARHTN